MRMASEPVEGLTLSLVYSFLLGQLLVPPFTRLIHTCAHTACICACKRKIKVTVIVNPRRACARVTVVALCVCVSVCPSVTALAASASAYTCSQRYSGVCLG